MTIHSQVQKPDAGKIIEVFEIDTTGIGGSERLYFHAGSDENSLPIVWQGITYQPFPVEAKGFEVSARGTLPRPSLQVANVTSAVSALLRAYDDLIGARVVRRRTFSIYLDDQPGADPNQHFHDDVYFVERKVGEDHESVEFELASAMDLHGVQLPGRTIIAGSCPSDYRGVECSYAGTSYFNVLNLPETLLANDVCSKAVQGCKARFGARARLPFGGFPAARIYRS